jgi:hypothetical protein
LKDKDPKTMFSSEGLLGELKKALAERVLNAEMDSGPRPLRGSVQLRLRRSCRAPWGLRPREFE